VWSGAPDSTGILSGEANQGDDNVGEPHDEIGDKKLAKPKNCLDYLEIGRRGQMLTASVWLCHRDASRGNHEAQELDLLRWNKHSSGLECKSYSRKAIQDAVGREPGGSSRSLRHEDVIEVGLLQRISVMSRKIWFHEGLERSGSVGEPHRHDQEFEGAIACPEGCFPSWPAATRTL